MHYQVLQIDGAAPKQIESDHGRFGQWAVGTSAARETGAKRMCRGWHRSSHMTDPYCINTGPCNHSKAFKIQMVRWGRSKPKRRQLLLSLEGTRYTYNNLVVVKREKDEELMKNNKRVGESMYRRKN